MNLTLDARPFPGSDFRVPTSDFRSGVTLIEILIVVTIMGIAGTIVVPALVRPGQLAIQAASRLVISDILMAQNEAVGQAATRRLEFDKDTDGYRLTDKDATTLATPWMKNGYVVSFAGDRRFKNIDIDAVDFGGNAYVEFDELGGTTTGGTVEITADGYRYRITVKPITGRVTVAPVTE